MPGSLTVCPSPLCEGLSTSFAEALPVDVQRNIPSKTNEDEEWPKLEGEGETLEARREDILSMAGGYIPGDGICRPAMRHFQPSTSCPCSCYKSK